MSGVTACPPRLWLRPGFILDKESAMQQQFEAVHSQAQICDPGLCRFVRGAGFHALGGAMKALTQSAVFVGVAQLAKQPANLFRPSPGLFHQQTGGGEGGSAGRRILEEVALERAALPRSILIQPASEILAQRRTGLGKAGDGQPAARNGNRQPERLQFPGIIAPLEFNEVEERAVATEPARAAELFACFHGPHPPPGGRPEARRGMERARESTGRRPDARSVRGSRHSSASACLAAEPVGRPSTAIAPSGASLQDCRTLFSCPLPARPLETQFPSRNFRPSRRLLLELARRFVSLVATSACPPPIHLRTSLRPEGN